MTEHDQNGLLLGAGTSNITPRQGVALSGFGPYLNRNATGIHAPLMARCLFLEDSHERILILSLELCGLSPEIDKAIRERIVAECGLSADSILISCTHTHSAPQTAGHMGWGHPDDLYVETLPGRIIPAVVAAIQQTEPVTAFYANPDCVSIGINREQDSAYDRSMPVDARLDPTWKPSFPELTDTTCRMLVFKSNDGILGMLHNFGCHPVVCCEACTQIHGDFPGLASRAFESAHPGSTAVFLPGALGDINPPVSHRPERESLRALEVISRRYAKVLEDGLNQAQPVADITLENQLHRVRLPRVDWDMTAVENFIAQLEKRLHETGLVDDPLAGSDNPMNRVGMDMVRLAGLRKLKDRMLAGEAVDAPVSLQGIRIGSVHILGAPFEIYNATRLAIESRLADSPCMLVSLANGSFGYAPDEQSYTLNPYTAEFVSLMGGHFPFLCLHDLLVHELTLLFGNKGQAKRGVL